MLTKGANDEQIVQYLSIVGEKYKNDITGSNPRMDTLECPENRQLICPRINGA